jgi:toxin ParE1/3/4
VNQRAVYRNSQVERDLTEIALYIGEDNPTAARRFLDAAEATFGSLALTPGLGRQRKFKNARLGDLRSWRVKGFSNYLVFYQPIEHGIQVIRVLHGAKNLEALF